MERVFCLCVIVWNRREGKLQSCSCGDRERASPHRRHRPALPAAGRDDVGAPKSCMQFRSDLRARGDEARVRYSRSQIIQVQAHLMDMYEADICWLLCIPSERLLGRARH